MKSLCALWRHMGGWWYSSAHSISPLYGVMLHPTTSVPLGKGLRRSLKRRSTSGSCGEEICRHYEESICGSSDVQPQPLSLHQPRRSDLIVP